MDHRTIKIYNQEDFNRITKGIKVAQCMQSKSSSVPDAESVLAQLEELVVSDSLSCSFCNTIFENKAQQRLHYKLDWHRYNLKQRLLDLKSITEDEFGLLADDDDVSSLSGSESESEAEDETGNSESGSPSSAPAKVDSDGKGATPGKSKNSEKKSKQSGSISDSSDTEVGEEVLQKKKMEALLAIASRHSKVFFENEEGNIFSIYRCLLHNKKEIPEIDNEMIAQALESGKKTTWTVIMLGGGHFAAAVFQDGKPIINKTFHSYTVRARQGSSQSSRDMRTMGSHPKSAGASLRRYNEAMLVQHIQDLLESWTTHISNSSLILYRAVGPYNRTVLFGGKNPPLDKNDPRLRPLPFPTRRATFSEVNRAYDILSTIEIYGWACDFTDSFPISPRQPIKKRVSKIDLLDEIPEREDATTRPLDDSTTTNDTSNSSHESGKNSRGSSSQLAERQHRSPRSHIDRARPRKSPRRPLPDIVARLAQSSSESEPDQADDPTIGATPIIAQDFEIDFKDHLQAFQNTAPRHVQNRKFKRQKRKGKKERVEEPPVNEVLAAAKLKLWDASKAGDTDAFAGAWDSLLAEIKRCEQLEDQVNQDEDPGVAKPVLLRVGDLSKAMNESNEDGNTMLHLAAIGGHLRLVTVLLEKGSDPCNKNKKLQTPYAAATDKETRNTFRRFMGNNPDKFDYHKSQIPGPLTEEMEEEELEKKKMQKRAKRERGKIKKKEFEEKRKEEESRQRFLSLSDREKRALAAEQRLQQQGAVIVARCFQCGADIGGLVPFEYNFNRFCSMPCLKEHRLHHKFIL